MAVKPSEKSTIRYAKSIVAEALPGVQKIRAIAPGNDRQTMHNPGACIISRLHNHAGKISAVRRQRREDCTKLIRQATLQYDPVFGITDHDHTVVRVQVYSAELHVGLRQVKGFASL
jgi:hypothetical protein